MKKKISKWLEELRHEYWSDVFDKLRTGCLQTNSNSKRDIKQKLDEVTKQRDAAFEWRKEQFGLAIQQRDEAMEELAEMTAQRDEALEELAEVTQQCDELQSQLSEMTARAMSMVFMIPPETLAGDLQKFKDECKDLLERSKVKGGEG